MATATPIAFEVRMGCSDRRDVERVPDEVSGAWLVKGTGVQADAVLDNASDGFTADEIFDGLPIERVQRILDFTKTRGFEPG